MASEYDFITKHVKSIVECDGFKPVDPSVVYDVVRWLKSTNQQHTATRREIVAAYDALRWKKEQETCQTQQKVLAI